MPFRALTRLLLVLATTLILPFHLTTPTVDGDAQFPVTVLSCQRDPGNAGGPQGREDLRSEYGCQPAANVGVTAYSRELGYQERCDTDAEGICSLTTPSGPEVDIQLAIHTAMLPVGKEPREPVVSSRNYTEFRGETLVILPDDQTGPRQVVTMNVSGCNAGACTDRDVLVQVSAADITARDAPWFAPDDSGRVRVDLGAMPGAIDLMLSVSGKPSASCTDDANGAAVAVQWLDEREGTFARIDRAPGTTITCDVDLAG